MGDGNNKNLSSLVGSRSGRLRAELKTLVQIQRNLEGAIELGHKQGETGEIKMLGQALGKILEKIEKIRATLKSLDEE